MNLIGQRRVTQMSNIQEISFNSRRNFNLFFFFLSLSFFLSVFYVFFISLFNKVKFPLGGAAPWYSERNGAPKRNFMEETPNG